MKLLLIFVLVISLAGCSDSITEINDLFNNEQNDLNVSQLSGEEQPDELDECVDCGEKDDPIIYSGEIMEETIDWKSEEWISPYNWYEDIDSVDCKSVPLWCIELVKENKMDESRLEEKGEIEK